MSDFQRILDKAQAQRIIYKNQYDLDNINSKEDIETIIAESDSNIRTNIDTDAFVSSQPKHRRDGFTRLAVMCGRLAVYNEAEISIKTDTEENIATVFITSPAFVWRCPQLAYFQAVCIDASEVCITPSYDNRDFCALEIVFDFKTDGDKLVNVVKNIFT